MAEAPDPGKTSFLRSPAGIALVLFGAIAAFFLIAEHRAHALGILPYLILLACPLLHIFMHRGHGGHGGHGQHGRHSTSSPPADRGPTSADRDPPGGGTKPGGPTS